jgi:hypothetical protein
MINIEQFFEYLKLKIPDFQKTSKKGQFLITCVNEKNHKYKGKSPTMTPMPGSDKFCCLQCGFKGTVCDCVRTLEEDKKLFTDGQVLEYLTNSMKIDAYPELDEYKKYKFSLLPIAKNGKIPLEKGWTGQTHYEKSDWLKWIEGGLNLGIRTGEVSGITIIDVDLKIAPTLEMNEIYKELTGAKTLTQNTPHGKHFIFKYDKDIKQTSKIAGMTIDVRNDGGQILCCPSKINNLNYDWVNLGSDIKNVPENVKVKLLSNNKVDNGRNEEMSLNLLQQNGELPKLKNNNLTGCCNDTFIKLGGILINRLSPDLVKFVLSVFNTQLLETPMPYSAIDGMIGSLEGYKETEESTHEKAILECCKLLQCDISAKDVMEHTGLKRAIVDKYLAKLHKEGKLVRKGRGRYELKQQIEWVTEPQEFSAEYKYNIPYFNDVAYFHSGDIVLLGTPSGHGKTHISMNIIKQMKEQGVIPYYISLESGSRHEKIAQQLGLSQKDYYISKESIDNPTQIEIEPNSFTIIDWLYTGEDFAMTQSVFKHLADEMRRKGGILVVFTQLKENYDYFAVNLIKSFPSFAARYIYDDTARVIGHWDVDKIRDSKGHNPTARIDCTFDFGTKLLTKKEII